MDADNADENPTVVEEQVVVGETEAEAVEQTIPEIEMKKVSDSSNMNINSASSNLVATGVLFNSFEADANYEAKKAELRRLGMLVDSFDDFGSSSGALDETRKKGGKQQQQQSNEEDPATIATLRRQVEHRDAISSLISAKSAEEAEQYNSIIAALRSEIQRREQVADDCNATLNAQVEALRSVLERRRDSDSDAVVKYSDVEDQCKENISLWRSELARRLENVSRVGEESLLFINGLVKRCEEYAAEQADSQNSARKDLDTVKKLMSEATMVKVTLLQGRLRPVLMAESLSKLRLVYKIGPGQVSDEVASILAEEMRAEINQITEDISKDCSLLIRTKLDAGAADTKSYAPVYISQELERLKEKLKELSNERGHSVVAVKKHHTADALSEVKRIRQRCTERREAEERCLREKVVELTRLVNDQRAGTQALRSQLVADINMSTHATLMRSLNSTSRLSGGGGGGAGAGRDEIFGSIRRVNSSPTGGSGLGGSMRKRGNVQQQQGGQQQRRREGSSVKKLSFDPLSEAQIHELYGNLTMERTVVEEVPMEELQTMAKYAKTQRVGDGTFIPLKRKPSAATGTKQQQKQQPPSKGSSNQQQLNQQQQFSSHELATLKELRRLRTKVIGK